MMRTVKWAQVGRCGWLLVLLFLLSGLECRPQGQDSGSTVEFIQPFGLRIPKRLNYPVAYDSQFFGNNLHTIDPASNQVLYSLIPLQIVSNTLYNSDSKRFKSAEGNKVPVNTNVGSNVLSEKQTPTAITSIQKNDDIPLNMKNLQRDVEEIEQQSDDSNNLKGSAKHLKLSALPRDVEKVEVKPKTTSPYSRNRSRPQKLVELPENVEELDDMLSTISSKQEIDASDVQASANNTSEALKANSPPSLAPYRAHPLLHYVKEGNTISKDKIISFRNPNGVNQEITTLILKPVARSVAGVEGKAVSNPLSKAILRDGVNVDILFEPDAVAIAGPGGVAHAQSDLEISYEDVI